MRAKVNGKILAVWKDKEDGWCMKTSVEGYGRFRTVRYIHLPCKPRRKEGTSIRRGSII